MGNLKNGLPRLSLKQMRKRRGKKAYAMRLKSENSSVDNNNASQSSAPKFNPKRLSVLCNIVVRKYKLVKYLKLLQKKEKPIVDPESCIIVGGKPLRKRKLKSATAQPEMKKKSKKSEPRRKKQAGNTTKSILPQSVPNIPVKIEENSDEPEIRIKIEPGHSNEQDEDPLAADEESYTVTIKDEIEEDTETLTCPAVTDNSSKRQVVMPTLVPTCSKNEGPSRCSGPPLMTVVGDDIQIFANSIAEQLRAFPLERALMLQLDIQTMIDDERKLLLQSRN